MTLIGMGKMKILLALDSRSTGSSKAAVPDNCCIKFWDVTKEPVRKGAHKQTHKGVQFVKGTTIRLSDPDTPLLGYIEHRYKQSQEVLDKCIRSYNCLTR